jgi:hypothetical protein
MRSIPRLRQVFAYLYRSVLRNLTWSFSACCCSPTSVQADVLFAFRPLPRYKHKDEKSWVGGIATVIVACLMIFYIVYTLERFVSQKPTITT